MSEVTKHHTDIAQHTAGPEHGESIHLPAGTSWPIVLAFGCTLLLGGILLGVYISLLGAVLVVFGCVGWFRQLFPHEHAEHIPVVVQPIQIETVRKKVDRYVLPGNLPADSELPASTPIMAGLKGGIAGGIAMVVPALIYGVVAHHSIWYAINLLGGAGLTGMGSLSTASLDAFHPMTFLIAIVIHVITSLLVGLLYGALLPMLPRHPIVLGGILAPVLWTGLLHSSLGLINPTFDARISWPWFVVSQIAFGLVAGWIVSRDESYRRVQKLPFAMRAGLEIPGIMHGNEKNGNGEGSH
jgi:hypothetical protein